MNKPTKRLDVRSGKLESHSKTLSRTKSVEVGTGGADA